MTVVIRIINSNNKAVPAAMKRMDWLLVLPGGNKIIGGIRNSAKARKEREVGKLGKDILIITG